MHNLLDDGGLSKRDLTKEEAIVIATSMEKRLFELWGDPQEIERQVLASQQARRCIVAAGTMKIFVPSARSKL
eukprot:SAG31_NODE_3370_length_4353_cov_5.039962_2_plen_73_part_00